MEKRGLTYPSNFSASRNTYVARNKYLLSVIKVLLVPAETPPGRSLKIDRAGQVQ